MLQSVPRNDTPEQESNAREQFQKRMYVIVQDKRTGACVIDSAFEGSIILSAMVIAIQVTVES